MNRRDFLAATGTTALLPGASLAYGAVDYAPATWPDLRDGAGRVVLNFRASWSLTCKIKAEIIAELLTQTPGYAELTFVDVDWDTFGPSEWVQRRLKVERRSTLVALRDGEEIARLVNQPDERRIRAFLDMALGA